MIPTGNLFQTHRVKETFKAVGVNKVGKGKHIPKGHQVQGKEDFKNFNDNAKEKGGLRLGTDY